MGDFNLMYKASDNSNHRINNRLINSFREVLEELEVKPLHLHVKRFTWSSGTANPTLTKIDHFFISKYWELPNPHCYLQAIGTSMSDHCPMLITCSPFPRCYRGFLFEVGCIHMPEFRLIVEQSWSQPLKTLNKAQRLHVKLARLAKVLKWWHKLRLAELRRDSDDAQRLVLGLDQAQEQRSLDDSKMMARRVAKDKILAMEALRKIRLRQRSRLRWIKGRVSAWRRKNFIPSLQVHNRTYTAHEDKEQVVHQFFCSQFGTPTLRTCTLNWEQLQLRRHDLVDLDRDLTDAEMKAAISQTPLEKATGPDGYIGAFYKACWPIVKQDVMAAVRELFNRQSHCCNLLNSANITLLPKEDGAQGLGDHQRHAQHRKVDGHQSSQTA
jgi:hypothetical protein